MDVWNAEVQALSPCFQHVAFHYHVNSSSCAALRALQQDDNAQSETVPSLDEALIASPDVLEKATNITWQELALLSVVQGKHHHCIECNHWSTSPQYVRRHMATRHPECTEIVQSCIKDIIASKLSLSNPCQYCGQSFRRKNAHLRACIGVFNGVYLHRRLAGGKALALSGSHSEALVSHVRQHAHAGRNADFVGVGNGDARTEPAQELGESDRPGSRGQTTHGMEPGNGPGGAGSEGATGRQTVKVAQARGRAKRKGQESASRPGLTLQQLLEKQRKPTEHTQAAGIKTGPAEPGGGTSLGASGDPERSQHGLDPRDPPGGPADHPAPGHGVHDLRADPGAGQLGSVVVSDREDVARHQAGRPLGPEIPHACCAVPTLHRDDQGPLRTMMKAPSSRSTAESLGWIQLREGGAWPEVDTTRQAHVRDTSVESLGVKEIEEALDELLICARQQLVMQRFHATRQLAAEYQFPVIGMLLEVGVAHGSSPINLEDMTHALKVRSLGLRRLLSPPRAYADECPGKAPFQFDAVRHIKLGNRLCFCYANALMLSLIHLDCHLP